VVLLATMGGMVLRDEIEGHRLVHGTSRASASVARIAPLPSHDMFDQTQEAL